jgi:hypothetical protein
LSAKGDQRVRLGQDRRRAAQGPAPRPPGRAHHLRTDPDPTEAEAARAYIVEAGYRVAAGYLPERASYRVAQNSGRAVTEAAAPTLRTAADVVVQSLIDAIPE